YRYDVAEAEGNQDGRRGGQRTGFTLIASPDGWRTRVKVSSAPGLYRVMALIRRFEERAIELVRSGEIASGIHPCIGQEAVAAGLGAALRDDDVLYSNHRAHGHLLAKGSDPGALLAELAGRVNGVARGRGGSFHPSDFSVGVYGCTGSVGHGAPMAV